MHDNADFLSLEDQLRRARNESLDVRRQFEDLEQLLIDFLNYNPALSFIKDEEGRYLYASKSFGEFFRVEPHEFLGKTDFEWLPEHLARQFTENDDRVRATGKPTEIIETVPLPQGTIHSIVYKFPIVTPSGRQFVGGIAVDITHRTAAEQKIEQLNQQLETRIGELARMNAELEKTRDQAVKASSIKSAFLAHVSHELRTPVAAIVSASELLLDTPLAEEQRELTNVVESSASVLLHLLNDILDLSAIEAGKLAIDSIPFDPAKVVRESVQSGMEILREKGLALRVELDPEMPASVTGDAVRIQQVLRNLLSNAVKYTMTGTVTVRTQVIDEGERSLLLQFAVEDTGIGINESDVQLLFRPFTQIDSGTTRKYGGTGLGLAISKNLVEMMGGKIEVSSRVGHGSIFSFVIPFSIEPGLCNFPPADPESVALPTAKHILVVEDSPAIQTVLLKQLSQLGLQADLVSDGRQAVEAMRNIAYDLVLMDCHLPEMDGYEATRSFRRLETATGKHIPVIAVTASAMKGDAERCLEAGMDDYLSKPVSFDQLRRTLQRWLGPTA